jgi:hypothetical protein
MWTWEAVYCVHSRWVEKKVKKWTPWYGQEAFAYDAIFCIHWLQEMWKSDPFNMSRRTFAYDAVDRVHYRQDMWKSGPLNTNREGIRLWCSLLRTLASRNVHKVKTCIIKNERVKYCHILHQWGLPTSWGGMVQFRVHIRGRPLPVASAKGHTWASNKGTAEYRTQDDKETHELWVRHICVSNTGRQRDTWTMGKAHLCVKHSKTERHKSNGWGT